MKGSAAQIVDVLDCCYVLLDVGAEPIDMVNSCK